MNTIWTAIVIAGVIFAFPQGSDGARHVTNGLIKGAEEAVVFTFGLIGILAFWSGMLRVAEKAGITHAIGYLLSPIVRRLFPSIPAHHPANASIVMALSANLLGLGNAATPLGLKVMSDLADLNEGSDEASDAMCTFLALSTSSVTLIPGTVIAVRAAAGSTEPAAIVGTTILATLVSTFVALTFDRLLRRTRTRNGGASRD